MLLADLDAEVDVVHEHSACIDDFYYNVDLKEMLPNRKYRTIGMILFHTAFYIVFVVNLFQPIFTFHIETSHLICTANCWEMG